MGTMVKPTGEQSFGERIRELREERDMPQDEFARRARQAGLKWTRSTVAKIEGGQRDLKAGELSLLPFVLPVAFEEWYPTTRFTNLGRGLPKMQTKLLHSVVHGVVPVPAPPGRAEPAEAEEKAARALGWSKGDVMTRAVRVWGWSLTWERERRLRERLGGRSVPPESQQAIRGRITRQLIAELVQVRKERKR